jgi:hypothetical protein
MYWIPPELIFSEKINFAGTPPTSQTLKFKP